MPSKMLLNWCLRASDSVNSADASGLLFLFAQVNARGGAGSCKRLVASRERREPAAVCHRNVICDWWIKSRSLFGVTTPVGVRHVRGATQRLASCSPVAYGGGSSTRSASEQISVLLNGSLVHEAWRETQWILRFRLKFRTISRSSTARELKRPKRRRQPQFRLTSRSPVASQDGSRLPSASTFHL